MKKIHKRVAALLFAVAMTGLPVGTAFFYPSGGMTVWAEAAEEAAEASTEAQAESAAAEEISAETQAESAAAEETPTEAQPEQPEVQITINTPEGWQSDKAKVGIRAEDVRNTGNFSVAKAEARISENGGWKLRSLVIAACMCGSQTRTERLTSITVMWNVLIRQNRR